MANDRDRILIVEDEGIVALELEERLSQLGYDIVGVAATGRGAITAAREGNPDLVLMDINLPGELDGAEAAKHIKAELGCAIVFLTAYGGDETLARAKQVEPLAYVLKPFNERSLDVTVQLALLRHRAERDRDLARAEQSKSEARLAAILDQSHDGIVSVDENEIIRVFNQGAERIFGYQADEVLGQSLAMLIPADKLSRHHQSFKAFREAAGAHTEMGMVREVHGVRKGGEIFPAEITISHLKFRDEHVFTACLRDIGERRRLEEQFVQAQRMQAVGRLAASVVHDFNNLLAALQSNAYLLGQEVSETGQHRLDEIESVVDRGIALTRRLLAFCRPRSKMTRAQRLDLNGVVDGMNQLLTRLLHGTVTLEVQLDEKAGHVLVDRYLVEQVIMNLIVNARDAMPHGGKITVRTFAAGLPEEVLEGARPELPQGRYAVLQVSDTGEGIPSGIASSIFEPFFTTKPEGVGTGLGLSTVKEIVTQTGGDVWFESESGKGTMFTVVLPSADTELRRTEGLDNRGNETNGVLSGRTVLIVEDDASLLSTLELLLTRERLRVISASSGLQALALVKSRSFRADLLLSDLDLPDLHGDTLAEQLLRLDPQLRVVFMTGFDKTAHLRRVPAFAEVPVLHKPFDPKAMLRVIGDQLRDPNQPQPVGAGRPLA